MIQAMEKEFLRGLAGMIAIPTIRTQASEKAPFGQGIRDGMDYLIAIAKEEGLVWKDLDGYAMHIEYGKGPLLGLLCHMDTVGIEKPELWQTDPFQLTVEGDFLYGRGVNDNKGPLMACMYLLIAMKRRGMILNRKIRLIVGGAEETSWEGIQYYFQREEMPEWGISPDGNFPIVNCEKGVRYYVIRGFEISDKIKKIISANDRKKVCAETVVIDHFGSRRYRGVAAPSRHPLRGENSVVKMCQQEESTLEIFEKIKGFYHEINTDPSYSTNISSFSYQDEHWCLELNLMWENDAKPADLDALVEGFFGSEYDLLIDSKPRLYLAPDDSFLSLCKEAYKEVTGADAELLTKGGASYARVLKKGIAFGPCWPGEISNQHGPNERQSLTGLYRAVNIYEKLIEKCGQ